MPKPPPITDAEWSIMKALWQRPKEWLVAAEVIDPVTRERNIHHRTARTLLARLVKKRAVETRPASSGGGYLYRAKVSQEEAVRAESRSFLSRVFDGNAAPALLHLLNESEMKLSSDELKNLRALLKAREET